MIFKTKGIKIQAMQVKELKVKKQGKHFPDKIFNFAGDFVRYACDEYHGCRLLYCKNKNWYSNHEIKTGDYLVKFNDNEAIFKFSEEEFNLIFEKVK